MGGHKRDHSDSHMPLHQSEIQASYDANVEELQVRVESPAHGQHLYNGDIIATSARSQGRPISLKGAPATYPLMRVGSHIETFSAAVLKQCMDAIQNTRLERIKTGVAGCCMMLSAFLSQSHLNHFYDSGECIAGIFLLLADFFLLTVIHDIVPQKPLDDLVFFLIPQQRWAWAVGDVLSTVNAVVGIAIVILHRERMIILRRIFLLGAILYGLRAVVLSVTFLPSSFANRDDICLPQINRTAMYATEIATRFVTYVVTLGLNSGSDKILCGDLMFSGHTVVLSVMYFVQLQYTPRGLVILRYIAAPITFLGIAALVVSGGHYTMDVLISYWLTSHVFWSYHQMFEMPKQLRTRAPLSRLWWFWLCYWFESDVPPGPMQNDWNWPFSRPRTFNNWLTNLSNWLQ